MKKVIIAGTSCLMLMTGSYASWAEQVLNGNLNSFTAGDTARAADVNENFDELQRVVNVNDTAQTSHAADAAAHHAKYTDAEAQAAAATPIATHAGIADAHHIRYADSEAVTAVTNSGSFAAASHTHVEADITDLGNCPSDMVKVGSFCIDKYEASITQDLAGTTPALSTDCNVNGNDCSALYAQSASGVTPSIDFTWFQAQQACVNVGKRLPTNAEWQAAAAGTPDDGTCVVSPSALSNAGSVPACVSRHGAFDMVGNVSEWVADWVSGGAAESTSTGNFGGDRIVAQGATNQTGNVNMPAALIRGGSHNSSSTVAGVFFLLANASPAYHDTVTGFRCAK